MAELKTKMTRASVPKFLSTIKDKKKKLDCRTLLSIMKRISKEDPKMWGTSIIGFGRYHYRYASGREGDWFRIGFSPRERAISIYVTAGFGGMEPELRTLGRHTTGGCCLYVRKLDEVDRRQLTRILATGYHKQIHHERKTHERER